MPKVTDGQHIKKGAETRERIFNTALRLIVKKGYERTTLREIARVSKCSLGLTYHYFKNKEALVLALYGRLADEFVELTADLAAGSVAERFDAAMRLRLRQLDPYRSALTALFGAALNPESGVSALGDQTAGVRQRVSSVFATVVRDAHDRPPEERCAQMTTMLYGLHLALVLFWLSDRTTGQRAEALLEVMCAGLRTVTPLLQLPGVAHMMDRLVDIVGPTLMGTTSAE